MAPPLPRLPAALLRTLLPVAERAEVLADIEAEYRERMVRDGAGAARAWVWRQALSSWPSLLRRSWWRGWTGFEPMANAFSTGGPSMEQWIMDARFSVRRLLRRPMYAALAIGTLALGVGGTAAIFGIAKAVLYDPLPYKDPGQIGLFWFPFSWNQQEFTFLRNSTPGMSQIAQYRNQAVTLEQGTSPARLVPGISTSHELFGILGTGPMLGRTFEPQDDVQGAEPVAVLSYGLWRDLGGDPAVLGSRVRLDGRPFTVIGVMPRGFWFPSPAERVWVAEQLVPDERVGNFALVGRVAPGNSLQNFGSQLNALTRMLGERFQYVPQWDKTKDAWIRSAEEVAIRPLRPAILATLVAMGMILLIACANVAALMLAQVEGRSVELAVRSAMGADRRRLAGQLVAESMIVGISAGVIGALVAAAAFRLLVNALPLGAWAETAALDWRVFLLALVFAVTSSLLIALVPVFALWRGQLRETLVNVRTVGIGGRGVRLESTLVVAEVALAVLMAAGAGVLGRSLAKLYAIDPGFNPNGVGVIDLVLPSDLPSPERSRILASLTQRVRNIPGVEQAGLVQQAPIRSGGWNTGVAVEGKSNIAQQTTLLRLISPGYLEALSVPIRQGRGMAVTDLVAPSDSGLSGVALINESFARKYFEGENPLGKWVGSGFNAARYQVIGVVGNVAEHLLTDDPEPVRYIANTGIPFVPQSQTLVFQVRGRRDPVPLLALTRQAVREESPRIAIAQTTTMDMEVARAVGPVRQIMTLVSLLTGLALLLGAIGIYGVMSHYVLRRKRDWGIKIALGLEPIRVISSVVGRGTGLVAMGIGVGLVSFLFLGRLLRPLIYGIGASDPAAIGLAAVALMLVGLVAALLPAARAGRTDPAVVFRDQ